MLRVYIIGDVMNNYDNVYKKYNEVYTNGEYEGNECTVDIMHKWDTPKVVKNKIDNSAIIIYVQGEHDRDMVESILEYAREKGKEVINAKLI